MHRTLRLGFLCSHSGSSMRAIVAAIADGTLDAEARIVIGNNAEAAALGFAAGQGIAVRHISATTEGSAEAADAAIAEALAEAGVELVILSGYLRPVGPAVLRRFAGHILNIHPALLPNHGGKGMYGQRVHEAVIRNRDTETGATVHVVDGEYDHGPVVGQARVPVLPGDTADAVRDRVMAAEPALYIATLREIARRGKVLPD